MRTIVACIIIFCFSCTNKITSTGAKIYKGKLVISALCGHYVVQALERTDSTLVDNWSDQQRNQTYNSVFTVRNLCEFGNTGIKEGEEFQFSFTQQTTEDCARCMAYYPVPEKQYSIRIIK